MPNKLKIVGEGPLIDIILDGKKMELVQSATLCFDVGKMPLLTLEILVDRDIDVELDNVEMFGDWPPERDI